MTEYGLSELLDIQADVAYILSSVLEVFARIRQLSTISEDVLDVDAHKALQETRTRLLATHEEAVEVFKSLQRAYDAEKALKNTYDGLLNKQDNGQ